MIKFPAFLAFIVLFTSQPLAQENTISVNGMLDVCNRLSMNWVDFCNGFFQAVHDINAINEDVCTPPGLTRTDLVELFEKAALRMVKADPSVGEISAVRFGSVIFKVEFPCN